MKKYIGYTRVSTKMQGKSGLGLDAQQKTIKEFAANDCLIEIYTDIESGKNNDREELNKALKACEEHNATLLVAYLDRLSRDSLFISKLMKDKIDFIACDSPNANELAISLLAMFAEYHYNYISQRTKEAIQAKKNRGEIVGNGKLISAFQIKSANDFAQSMKDILEPYKDYSYNHIAQILNEKGLKTIRGKQWFPQSVKDVMGRIFPKS